MSESYYLGSGSGTGNRTSPVPADPTVEGRAADDTRAAVGESFPAQGARP